MKTFFTLIAMGLGLGLAQAQDMKADAVPAAVKEGFAKKFPNSKAEKWEKEGANYEAEFHANKVEHSAVFDASGNFMEVEMEIPVAALPAPVTAYISKNMAGKKVKEASKITDVNGKASYEAEIDDVDYLFDADGNLLKKEAEGKDGDKD